MVITQAASFRPSATRRGVSVAAASSAAGPRLDAPETIRPEPSPGEPGHLHHTLIAAIRARHYSRRTEQAYWHWTRQFVLWSGKRHPRDMGAPEIGAFLSHLAMVHSVSASTQRQALSALLFLYRAALCIDVPWIEEIVRAKQPVTLPVVLTRDEVSRLWRQIPEASRRGLVLRLLYGTGMRLLEGLRLRMQDIDFSAGSIAVRGGKGRKDRTVMLPRSVAAALRSVMDERSDWHQSDLVAGRAGYESAIRFWTSSIGSQPLRALRPSHILTAIAARPGLSGKTVNNYVSVLRESMALAVADRLLDDNPAASIPRARHQKEPPDPFEASERDAIVAEAKRSIPASVANLVQFWFWTGMRTSEIAGLQWSSVDLASGRVVISEALVRGSAKRTTKTATARTVILNSFALEAVRAQREHTYLAGGPVWTDPRSGGPWHEERAFRRSYWTPILKRLGLRYRRPYQMRHTYATEMLMSGLKPAFCAKQLGHSVEVLLRVYAKWVDGERDDEEMAKLEAGARRDSVQDWPQDSSDGS